MPNEGEKNRKRYPLLPLRDVIIFPHMVVPLFVGREKSIKALQEVMKTDKSIVLSAQKNSGEICINGAAAHLATRGDLIIIVAYGDCEIDEAKTHAPKIVHVNKHNQIVK